MTSTYDHRVIQGAESGAFLRRVDQLLQGEDGFYEGVFEALGLRRRRRRAATGPAPVTAAEPVPAAATPAAAPVAPTRRCSRPCRPPPRLVKAHRMHGHLAAHLDPLGSDPIGDPALDPATVNLTARPDAPHPGLGAARRRPGRDLRRRAAAPAGDLLGHDRLRDRAHLRPRAARLAAPGDRVGRPTASRSTPRTKRRLLPAAVRGRGARDLPAQGLPRARSSSRSRASTRSCRCSTRRSSWPPTAGAREVVIGMAHRGRLNVLAHTVGRPYESILVEFEGEQTLVGRHGHARGRHRRREVPLRRVRHLQDRLGRAGVTVTLSPNPSHLEYVEPGGRGPRARRPDEPQGAASSSHDPNAVLPVLIHGDAAFPGQGVVAETLNLQALEGYTTGGTLHVIANNQLGFTTDPDESRSTRYASDLAKGFDIPIIHVNADDVEACISAVRLAHGLPRRRFSRDALIDLIGYRRFGHNETDEPAYTQPLHVRADQGPPAGAQALRGEARRRGRGLGRGGRPDRRRRRYERIGEAHTELKESMGGPPDDRPARARPHDEPRAAHDACPRRRCARSTTSCCACPRASTSTASSSRCSSAAARPSRTRRPIDWAHAEALAFASLLAQGVPIRLTGQDTERGTFSQRHAGAARRRDRRALVRRSRHLRDANAPFELHNSPLSEQACLGLRVRLLASQAPDALVLWEAQFGDFVNSRAGDRRPVPGLRPGQVGPDLAAHAAAAARLRGLGPRALERPARALPAARPPRATSAWPTAPRPPSTSTCCAARRWSRSARPLVVMTPKSLLRLPAATSTLARPRRGQLPARDRRPDAARRARGGHPARALLGQGLLRHRRRTRSATRRAHIAVARVELLYPFPENELRELMDSYPNLERVVWVQEEPRNMGARAFMRRRMAKILPERLAYDYVGRQLRAAPGRGLLGRPQARAGAHRARGARLREGPAGAGQLGSAPDDVIGHAAVHHVQHLAHAVAAQQARRRAPRAGRSCRSRRPAALGIDSLGQPVDVVVGQVHRPGDVAGLPLVALAHVEDLQLAGPLAQLGHRDALDPLDRTPLLAPAGHAAGEEARHAG